MTSFARIAAILGLLPGASACSGQAAKDTETGEAVNASARPITVSDSVPRDGNGADGRSIVDRVREPVDGHTFPPDFHGSWAPSLAECRGSGWVHIEAGGLRSPDTIAVPIEPVQVLRVTMPDGLPVATITVGVEQMNEGQVSTGVARMSRVEEHLYLSNADTVTPVEHWQYRYVRCPNPAYGGNAVGR
jgi:hypothetical protein